MCAQRTPATPIQPETYKDTKLCPMIKQNTETQSYRTVLISPPEYFPVSTTTY